MNETTLYADLIIPLAVKGTYTYAIPPALSDFVCAGQRVVVQFGKNRLFTAVILRLHHHTPADYTPKEILSLPDEFPVADEVQLRFWEWIAAYYICNPGEVMNAALPSGLKTSSETKITLNPDFDGDITGMSDDEYRIFTELAEGKVLSITQAAALLNRKSVYGIVRQMMGKGILNKHEEIKVKARQKTEKFVMLHSDYEDQSKLEELFATLEKSNSQLNLLLAYIRESDYFKTKKAVTRKQLLDAPDASQSSLQTMVKKDIFRIEELVPEQERLQDEMDAMLKPLSDSQKVAFDLVKTSFESKDIVLLHGVTSSGKTEVYIHLIKEMIAAGKQVLYLLPEIALTAQIIRRLQNQFGDSVCIYHSKLSEGERTAAWNQVSGISNVTRKDGSKSDPIVVLGARSSIFLPFRNLGLVIVDEEHESSFKQYDPAPRYHARDASIYLAKLHGAKTLLGSATPSIEAYYNALTDRFGFVELTGRFGGVQMPEMVLANIAIEKKKKIMKSLFSTTLLAAMRASFERGEQVILFQNRRGFSPMIECSTCAWIPRCKRCDVSMTYHKRQNHIICHYCGFSQTLPDSCKACGGLTLKTVGFGTEKIEEELEIFFPDKKIVRMDQDTTRRKNSLHAIITEFEEKKIDILVGTQMVTKGLDFENVGLVGIINADHMMNIPDFRAYERSFQLMLQVSGRAGRQQKRGKVIIQTHQPNHALIIKTIENDYRGMYEHELEERRRFIYPPFCRLINFTLRHADPNLLGKAADYFALILKKRFTTGVLGPEFPAVPRIRDKYLKSILLKTHRDAPAMQVRADIEIMLDFFRKNVEFRQVDVIADVDPV